MKLMAVQISSFLSPDALYPIGSNSAPKRMLLLDRVSSQAGLAGSTCASVEPRAVERAMDTFLKMNVEAISAMRYRAFSAWLRHTERWLPKLASINCSQKSSVNVERQRNLKIRYASKLNNSDIAVAECPRGSFVWSGGCRTASGIHALYPLGNSWVCISREQEQIEATAVCTSIKPDIIVVANVESVSASCPGKVGIKARRLGSNRNLFNKWKRSKASSASILLGGAGCEGPREAPIQSYGIESDRKGMCSGPGNWNQLYLTCIDIGHPMSKISIVSGPDAIAWCPSNEIAVGGGCRSLDTQSTILVSEAVHVCDPNLALNILNPLPAICSGWRCQRSATAASQIVTVICMAANTKS